MNKDKGMFLSEYGRRLRLLEEYKSKVIECCNVLEQPCEENYNFAMIGLIKERKEDLDYFLEQIEELPKGLRFGDVKPSLAQLKKLRNPFLDLRNRYMFVSKIIVSETSRLETYLVPDPIAAIKESPTAESAIEYGIKDFKRYKTNQLYRHKYYTRRKLKVIGGNGVQKEISNNDTIIIANHESKRVPNYSIQQRDTRKKKVVFEEKGMEYIWQPIASTVDLFVKNFNENDVAEALEDYNSNIGTVNLGSLDAWKEVYRREYES